MQLAKKLGVSATTVSFVMNGLAEKMHISKETAERVRAGARTHNYIANPFARSLIKRRSGVISVVLGNFKMDYAEAVMQGLQQVLDGTDRVPYVATHSFDVERNRRELLSSLGRRDEGIIAFPLPEAGDIYARIMEVGVPLVLFGEVMPGLEGISSVIWDAEAATQAAVQHLVSIGRKRIAFFGTDYPGIGNLHRFKAYRDVLTGERLALQRRWVATPPPTLEVEEMVRIALEQFFPAGEREVPDAVFAINDGLALPLLEGLSERGIRVPEDVAVIGLQDLPLSRHSAISLSTVREPVREMGEAAARMLLDLIEGNAKAPVRHTISSAEVIVRNTTGGAR